MLTAGAWWARFLLLRLLALLTWFMVITRVRNTAEHALTGKDDPLRNRRATLANRRERARGTQFRQ